MKPLVILACAFVLSACGGGSSDRSSFSPTAPSGPQFPTVAGNYSGFISMTLPELGESLRCPASTSVTQSGSSISIAPLTLSGECSGISVPFGAATIDTTGNLVGAGSTTVTQSCGTYTASGSGGFFGRELRLSIIATSRTCYNFNISATLSR